MHGAEALDEQFLSGRAQRDEHESGFRMLHFAHQGVYIAGALVPVARDQNGDVGEFGFEAAARGVQDFGFGADERDTDGPAAGLV